MCNVCSPDEQVEVARLKFVRFLHRTSQRSAIESGTIRHRSTSSMVAHLCKQLAVCNAVVAHAHCKSLPVCIKKSHLHW